MQGARPDNDAASRSGFACAGNEILTLPLEDKLKLHLVTVQHLLARMFEIDRDPTADGRLNLSKAPFRVAGVAHQHTGVQNGI